MPMLSNIPPFELTDEQFATVDACRSNDAKTMWLQVFHQLHCFEHRQRHAFGSLDPARFSKAWNARQAEYMADAWGAYYARCEAAAMGEAA